MLGTPQGTRLLNLESEIAYEFLEETFDDDNVSWSPDGSCLCMPVINDTYAAPAYVIHRLGVYGESGVRTDPETVVIPLHMPNPQWACSGTPDGPTLHDPYRSGFYHAHSHAIAKKRGKSHSSHAFSEDTGMLVVVAAVNAGTARIRKLPPATELSITACNLEHYNVSWEHSPAFGGRLMHFDLTSVIGRYGSVLDAASVAWNPSLIHPRMYAISDHASAVHLVDAIKHCRLRSWSVRDLFEQPASASVNTTSDEDHTGPAKDIPGQPALTSSTTTPEEGQSESMRSAGPLQLMWSGDGRKLMCSGSQGNALLCFGT